MPLYTYLAFTRALPGREAEFDRWYDEQHLTDVSKMPGIISAKRFQIEWQSANEFEPPQWRSLAVYEIDSDNPQATLTAIRAASGTKMMPLSEALTKAGMLQLLLKPAVVV